MGREVRMVPADWQHPKDERGRYIPKQDGSAAKRQREWDEAREKWERGERPDYAKDETCAFDEWEGARPLTASYMPDWPAEQRTHLMMYEDTSEGTPISPAFKTPEELARWLTDNGASAFGSMKATYEQWLETARGGWAPSMVADAKGLRSGVEAMADTKPKATP